MKGVGWLQNNSFYPHRVSKYIREERQMEFSFTADVKFSAIDLDDAFSQLKKHFESLLDTSVESPLEFLGKMEIKRNDISTSTT